MASLGTPRRGPAPPPPFVRCLARSLQACSVQPSQGARGALRAAGATCCISAESSPGARGGTEGGTRTELFVCSPSPESWIPWHGFSPPSGFPSCKAGGSPSKSCWGAAWLLRPGGRLGPRSPRLLSLGPGPGARPPWNSRGRSRGAQAASGRDPSRRVANKPGGNSFFPHAAPGDAGGERGDGGGRTDPGRGRGRR